MDMVEEGPQRPKMMSNASSSRGSVSSTYEQQDDGERNNIKCHLICVCVPYIQHIVKYLKEDMQEG